MNRDWCPKCQAIEDLTMSIVDASEKDADGTEKEIITESYSCSKCHMFIKSESREPVEASE